MRFLLLDRDEKLIRNLKAVVSAIHEEELNGTNLLHITTADEGDIEKGYRVVFKDRQGNWQEFIIREIQEYKEFKELFCEHSFYETLGDYLEDKRPSGAASHALAVALEPTRWEAGVVHDLGTNQTNFYHISAKEAVHKVAEVWKGEIRTRVQVSGTKITGRFVDLLNRRGADRGKRFTYTKDLEKIIKTTQARDIVTALYGYGKGEEIGDGYGRRLTFADINDGKAYVENNQAKAIWGRNNPDGTKAHIFGKVEFDDIEDQQELLNRTQEALEELSRPAITYQAKVIDLGAFGLTHENVELGDTVAVIDKDFKPEIRAKTRVIKIRRDLKDPTFNEITLGSFTKNIAEELNDQQKHIAAIRDNKGIWDRAGIISEDGTIKAQFIEGIIQELNDRINDNGGYTYISEDGEGIITYDKPIDQNPTKAIQIKGGSFRIANNKNPDGTWNWRTFGDGNGFVADLIIAGVLQGGKVKFDLTNGTFLIGNSVEDYKILFDGDNLRINLANGKSIEETIDDLNVTGRNLILNSRETKVTWQQYKNYTWEEVMV